MIWKVVWCVSMTQLAGQELRFCFLSRSNPSVTEHGKVSAEDEAVLEHRRKAMEDTLDDEIHMLFNCTVYDAMRTIAKTT